MSSLARVREVYERVVDLEGLAREHVLREACGPDDALRSEVEALLRAGEDAHSFMENPPSAVNLEELASIAGSDSGTFPKGEKLGAFTLLEPLGHGGMGVVYRAEQDRPRRTVALKLIRSPFLSPQLLRRFEQEAQVLALLRHPGIAQIYEAGAAPGPDGRVQPYYAMELVRGRPLIAFANERDLGVRDRLQLFALICDAVQHAHQKGVIHRDLKPANILVEDAETTVTFTGTTAASGPQPKILDFGVARITGSDIAVTTAGTDVGQLVGTIPYMSPEQVRGDVDGIDTRSDVYALGVVLFELLTGRLPYDVKGKAIAAAAVTITNEEPTAPGRVVGSLRGDIETIVLKALEKSPDRRYQSAAELASDVRRHLADLPIIARPATTAYQLRKFARRNKTLVGGVVAAFVMLVAGVIGTSIGLVRARSAQRLAEQRESEARVALRTAENSEQFLISMLTAASPVISRNRDLTVRELVDEAAMKVETQLGEEPAVALRTRLALGRTYLSINAPAQARAQADAALALASRAFGERSVEYSNALSVRAAARRQQDDVIGGIEDHRAVLALRTSLLKAGDPLIARAQHDLGGQLLRAGKFDEAEPLLREAKAALDNAHDSAASQVTLSLASLMMRSMKADRLGECRAMLDDAMARARAKGSAGLPELADVLATTADLDRMQKRTADSEARLRELIAIREGIYPASHPILLGSKVALSRALRAGGKHEEARTLIEPLFEVVERTFGPRNVMVSDLYREHSMVLRAMKDMAGAERSAQRVVDNMSPSEAPIQIIIAYTMVAQCQEEQQHWDDAVKTWEQALARAASAKASRSSISTLYRSLALALEQAGRRTDAMARLGEAMDLVKEGENLALVRSEVHEFMGDMEGRAGEPASAAAHYRAAVAESEPLDPKWAGEQWAKLAQVLETLKDVEGAAAARAKASALANAKEGDVSGQTSVPAPKLSPH